MTSNGMREGAARMKSPGPSARTSSTSRRATASMFSSAAASSLGVKAREMVRRSAACSAPSMFTMEFPNTALAQGAGSGTVTPGALAKTCGRRLAARTSACLTSTRNGVRDPVRGVKRTGASSSLSRANADSRSVRGSRQKAGSARSAPAAPRARSVGTCVGAFMHNLREFGRPWLPDVRRPAADTAGRA
ncbi:hypothetical protein OKW18_006301 [Streptomyces pratensis]|nr:hypothetical protein [Streptomyces pratensis]